MGTGTDFLNSLTEDQIVMFRKLVGSGPWEAFGQKAQGVKEIIDEFGGGLVNWAKGTITYVDASVGNDTTGDGTIEAPFATLQAAADSWGTPADADEAAVPRMLKITGIFNEAPVLPPFTYIQVVAEGSTEINGDITLNNNLVQHGSPGASRPLRFGMSGYAGADFRANDLKTFVHNGHIRPVAIEDFDDYFTTIALRHLFTNGVISDSGGAPLRRFHSVQLNCAHVDIEDGYLYKDAINANDPGLTIEAENSIVKSTICGDVKLYTINNCRIGDILFDSTPTSVGNGTGDGVVEGLSSSGYNGGFTNCRFSGSTYVLGSNGVYVLAPADIHVDAFSHKRLMAKTPTLNNIGLALDDYGAGVAYDNSTSGLTATDIQGALDELAAAITP